ncbi:hypothetical protein IWW47_000022 [Coemansia sp. RSA 2052]|nr:hypothetical protein IWW47_000022 [Coemansia sp. RSA 2052]
MARTAFASIVAIVVAGTGLAAGLLTGSGTITYHDYQSIPAELVVNNPPSCGMPYAQLDVTRITAVQQMNKATDCGQCMKVSNANDPSKFVYVLAVDTGGRGLDLSKPSFGQLFNIDDGVGPAQWMPVSNSNCVGIWKNAPPPPPVVQPPPPSPPVVQPPPPPPPVVQPPPPPPVVKPPPVVQPPTPSPPAVKPPTPPPAVQPPPPPPQPPVVQPPPLPQPPVVSRPASSSLATSAAPQTSHTRSIPVDTVPPQPPAAPPASNTYQGSSAGPETDESYPGGIGHNGESDLSSSGSSDAQTSEESSSKESSKSNSASVARSLPSAALAATVALVAAGLLC